TGEERRFRYRRYTMEVEGCDGFADGSGLRTGLSGRIASKCAPEGTPVTVSCRITETRLWREIVRKHSEDTAPGQWGTVAKAGRSGWVRGSSKRSLRRRPCFRKFWWFLSDE
ncbi:hypothetical protein JI435_405630, partial [Parastagonospora nodorum SN15]